MSKESTPTYPRLKYLGDMPIETFLKDYWQKKPLLVRQALPNFCSPVSADEIAGLALEEGVVSRLVIEKFSHHKNVENWQLEHGPLPESFISGLPDTHWTLLIQHADTLDPEINALLNAFRFIPNWRLDDIMVSYAPNCGGVGPHFDYFDVFLLQGSGKRRWRVGQKCDASTALIPDLPMKILQQFDTQEDWILEPGDLLYIPPQIAHWGEAIDESITYSIGFRAPSHSDILLDFSEEVASFTHEDERYSDPDLQLQKHSGEISADVIQKIKSILLSYCDSDEKIAHWLGEYVTRLKNEGSEAHLPALTCEDLNRGNHCQLSPFARCAFQLTAHNANCFINGQVWYCSQQLAESLSSFSSFSPQEFEGEDKEVLMTLAEAALLVSPGSVCG